MSNSQAKEDNLIQLKTNDSNTENVRVNNKINNLEKNINDIEVAQKKSASELRQQINDLNNKESDIEKNVASTLAKINSVESEISQLYSDIDKTNLVITENVKNIESEQSDLASKVSATYKQLGSVEKSYASLKTKSNKITKDINDITSHVETLSDEIRQQIIDIESNTSSLDKKITAVELGSIESSKQLTQGQEELIERTNTIISDASKTANALEKSIQENAVLLTNIEAKLVLEIKSLAQSTDEKTNELSNELTTAQNDIKAHSAKMLQLQSVDEALEKRATKLEETTQTLSTDTQQLRSATSTLQNRSSALEDSVETLEIQVYRIEQENEVQQAQLDVLRDKTSKTNQTLAALSRLVSFNFVATGAFMTLLVASVVGLYLYQDNLWSQEASTTAQRSEQVNQQISGLSQHVNSSDNQAAERIAQLETQVISLNQQLKTVNDKNVSLDNRLLNIAPHRKIGNDNVLHSQQWINQQADSHYAIRVLSATSEAEMFELAVRYNHNLTDVLSFKTEPNKSELSYALFMGNYSTQENAEAALKNLPFRLNGQEPSLTTYAQMK